MFCSNLDHLNASELLGFPTPCLSSLTDYVGLIHFLCLLLSFCQSLAPSSPYPECGPKAVVLPELGVQMWALLVRIKRTASVSGRASFAATTTYIIYIFFSPFLIFENTNEDFVIRQKTKWIWKDKQERMLSKKIRCKKSHSLDINNKLVIDFTWDYFIAFNSYFLILKSKESRKENLSRIGKNPLEDRSEN